MAALAGLAAAIQVMSKREKRRGSRGPQVPDGSRPIYGTPGRRFTPGGGIT